MKYKLIIILLIMVAFSAIGKAQKHIIIEGRVPSDYIKDSIELDWHYPYFGIKPEWKSLKLKINSQAIKAIIPVEKPILLCYVPFFEIGKHTQKILLEPGDSIHVSYNGHSPVFTGKGAEKFQLWLKLKQIKNTLSQSKPKTFFNKTTTLEDYLDWNAFSDKSFETITRLLDSYKSKLSPAAYNYLKAAEILEIEYHRLFSFGMLYANRTHLALSAEKFSQLFDLTLNKSGTIWLRNYPENVDQDQALYMYVRFKLKRQYGFEPNPFDDESQDGKRRIEYYNIGKKLFKGEALKKFLLLVVTSQGIKHIHSDTTMENLLLQYYEETKDTAIVNQVKNYAMEHRRRTHVMKLFDDAPDFTLMDVHGKIFNKDLLKDKIVCLCFWSPECKDLSKTITALKSAANIYRNDTNVVILTVSTESDKNKWLHDLQQAGFDNANFVHTSTVKYGKTDPTARDYVLENLPFINVAKTNETKEIVYNLYPSSYISVSDASGKIIYNSWFYPEPEEGKALIGAIGRQVSKKYDGPYVLHRKDYSTVYTLHNAIVNGKDFNKDQIPLLESKTDVPDKSFDVKLKKELTIEASEYGRSSRLFAFSDIEGNFDALRKLLQANKIIDENFNWIFGDGHLVFAGDMFDRGEQVTECLWLIYALEEKAKAIGGYVQGKRIKIVAYLSKI